MKSYCVDEKIGTCRGEGRETPFLSTPPHAFLYLLTPTPSSFPFFHCLFQVVSSRSPWGWGFWVCSLGFGSWGFAPPPGGQGVLSVVGALQGVFLCLLSYRVSLFLSVVSSTLYFCWVLPPPRPVSLHCSLFALENYGGKSAEKDKC